MIIENILKDTSKNIHMIGIGGVSMSGIADILLNMGFNVSGSDMNRSAVTDRLEKQGIKVIKTLEKPRKNISQHYRDNCGNLCWHCPFVQFAIYTK